MQTETMIGAKLAAKGFTPRNVKFQIALAEFQNNGGTWTDYLNIGRAAYGKGSEGQVPFAQQGHTSSLDASRKNDGAGLSRVAEKAILSLPSPSTQRNGAGHMGLADKASIAMPRPVSAAYIEAAKAGAQKIALTVLDSFKVRDGRAIGDLIFGELESLRANNAMEASVIRQIQRHAGNATANQRVRDVIKAADLERFVQRGAEVADAA
ncbi:hypothetical protein [Mesorhizobium sp.]|uniref:hypothetical protein n=1 Tax=Mesorhizobium sp. TaxID=1871066 RepID=UPI000FE85902|nr:hypothetical protein [Mesorhizobium sp.]RWN33438.1 MAG: hypothetical protein EOR95_15940 [Mesorhizobium sp.]